MPGLSFSPFNQQPNNRAPGEVNAPVQDAIKVMSFRMPSVVGGGAPAPGALLSGGSPFGAQLQGSLLQQYLQRILQGQTAGGMMPSPQAPQGVGGLGATNPFTPPPQSATQQALQSNGPLTTNPFSLATIPNGPSPTGLNVPGNLNPNFQFDLAPKAPDWTDVNFSGAPPANANPVSDVPMPRSLDQGWGGWSAGAGGFARGGRL